MIPMKNSFQPVGDHVVGVEADGRGHGGYHHGKEDDREGDGEAHFDGGGELGAEEGGHGDDRADPHEPQKEIEQQSVQGHVGEVLEVGKVIIHGSIGPFGEVGQDVVGKLEDLRS